MTSFDDSTGPGPHTCVYVLVDDHDECTICGNLGDRFSDLVDQFDPFWDGRDDRREFDGPEYDYEGGGA